MGELLANRYRLREVLGVGATATVYAAFDEQLALPVAIKLLHPQLDESGAKQIIGEATIAMELTHPHIIAYHGAYSLEGKHFIVLEYCEGRSLASLLEAGPLPVERVRSVLTALAYAHAKGILHRDLSPGNILISERPEAPVKLIDFGIAKIALRADTQTKNLGTPAYAAPEQLAGKPTTQSDLYGFGAVGFHMLCGFPPPFDRDRSIQSHFPATTPTQIADLIADCLAFDVSKRPPTAEAVLDRLEIGTQRTTVQHRRRTRLAFGLFAAAPAVLVVLIGTVSGIRLPLFYFAAKLDDQGVVAWKSSYLISQMLLSATVYDDIDLLAQLLHRDQVSNDSRALLIDGCFSVAVAQGSVQAARDLLDQGARFAEGPPLLYRSAIRSQSGPMLALLIERGFDIDSELEREDLFSLTVRYPDLQQFRVLVNHLAHRPTSRPLKALPLLIALSVESPLPLEIVRAAGPRAINATDVTGTSALHYLIDQGGVAQLKRALTIEGIDTNQRNKAGHTPLMIASGLQRREIVELLLNQPSIGPIDERDPDGFTALRHAVDPAAPFNPEVLQLLLAHGASPESRDVTGASVRRAAGLRGREELLPPPRTPE